MKRPRLAVIGVGHLGQHHARILAAMPDVDLVAVADARADQAQAVAAKCGTQAREDFRSLVDDVDAVTIAVPTFLHRDVATPFLSRGIATLIEKPIASTVAEAEYLTNLAATHNAVLQIGHIERFNPALEALTNSPVRPRYIRGERLSTYTFRSTDIGVVLDLMIHDIDLVLSLVPSQVTSVSAVGVSIFGQHEDVADARIEFADGTVASLTASRASFNPSRKMRIWGEDGYASLDFQAREATIIRPSENLKRGIVDIEGVDLTQPAAVKNHLFGKILEVDKIHPEPRESLAAELQNFITAARRLTPPRVPGTDGLRALKLADQIVQALRSHQWGTSVPAAAAGIDTPEPLFRGPHIPLAKAARPFANQG
jgi:predicted dehydrogenase